MNFNTVLTTLVTPQKRNGHSQIPKQEEPYCVTFVCVYFNYLNQTQ